MRLPEAIEIGKELYADPYFTIKQKDRDAIHLLIEAGKRCELARKETSFVGPGLLPGETLE